MENHGFPWPSMLDCDKFPMDNDMCITSQSDKNGSGVGQGVPKSISASNGAGGQTRKEQGKVISGGIILFIPILHLPSVVVRTLGLEGGSGFRGSLGRILRELRSPKSF